MASGTPEHGAPPRRSDVPVAAPAPENGQVRKGIKDVAALAAVSVGTVSNVLNRPDSVSGSTRERVEAAIAQLGFVRNESARQLRAGHSRTIAVVVMDIGNPFFADLVAGAEEVADTQGALVVVSNSAQDPAREKRHLALLEEQRVMGVLLSPTGDDPAPLLAALRRRGTPVVLVDRGTSSPDQCSVAVDDVLGGRLAGEHLLETGHRRVAFVGGPLALRQVSQRLEGFRAALGDVPVSVVESGGMSLGSTMAQLVPLLSRPAARRPTAVFCANDLLAMEVLRECTRLGLRVPTDVAIVGYDDIAFAAAAAVPLTSVRQPRTDLGRAGLRLLLDEVSSAGHRHVHTLFEPELVVRESSLVRRRAKAAPVPAAPDALTA